MYFVIILIGPGGSVQFCLFLKSFFSLFFRLGSFHCSIFKFINHSSVLSTLLFNFYLFL